MKPDQFQIIQTSGHQMFFHLISIEGTGAETVYLSLTQEEYEFWLSKDLLEEDCTLNYILQCQESGAPDWAPEDMDFMRSLEFVDPQHPTPNIFYPAWNEAPNIIHSCHGVDMDKARITIQEIESGDPQSRVIRTLINNRRITRWREFLTPDANLKHFVEHFDTREEPDYVLAIRGMENAEFFKGVLVTTQPIDLSRIRFHTLMQWTGNVIVQSVTYDDREVENLGGEWFSAKGFTLQFWSNTHPIL